MLQCSGNLDAKNFRLYKHSIKASDKQKPNSANNFQWLAEKFDSAKRRNKQEREARNNNNEQILVANNSQINNSNKYKR